MSENLEIVSREEMAVATSPETMSLSERFMRILESRSVDSMDVDKLQRLLEMVKDLAARDAESAFNRAMTEAQRTMPPVPKTSRNNQTNSFYAKLEAVSKVIVPVYTRCGFSLSYGTADCPIKDHYRITCNVSHSGGFSRHYQCDLPIDDIGIQGKPNKTKIHGTGSTMTYGQRYLACLIFNVTLEGVDDDGNRGALPKPPAPSSLGGGRIDRELKRRLVDLTRHIHLIKTGYALDDKAKSDLTQWLVDETFIEPEDTLEALTGDKLAKVLAKVERRVPPQP